MTDLHPCDRFCSDLAKLIESTFTRGGGLGGRVVVGTSHEGDGLIRVSLADGASYNVNVTSAR